MTTPAFLLAALLAGILFWGAITLLEPLLGIEARGRRLQRRLDARIARGTDLYFEELRSIESGIESNDRLRAQPRGLWHRAPRVYFLPFVLLAVGVLLLSLLGEPMGLGAPPYWTHRLGWVALAMLGVSNLVSPQPVFGSQRSTRIAGIAFLVISALLLADTIPFYLNPQFVTE